MTSSPYIGFDPGRRFMPQTLGFQGGARHEVPDRVEAAGA